MGTDVTAAWNIAIKDNDGASTISASNPFKSMKLTWSVENQGGGSAEIELADAQLTTAWAQPKRLVITGERPWGGSLTRVERSGKPSDIGPTGKAGWKASALSLINRLDYRIVRHLFVVNDSLDHIVAALLQEAQTQYNGNMNFSMGTTTGSFPTKLRTYCFGPVIGDAIRELASVGGGMDWEIAADGKINLWYPTRGTATGRSLAQTDCTEFDVVYDTSELLTTVSALGDPSDPFGPKHDMSRIVGLAATYGRKEAVIDTTVITDDEKNPNWQDDLQKAATKLLKTDGGGLFQLRTVWSSNNAPWALTDVWLNDSITVNLIAPMTSLIPTPVTAYLTDVTVTLETMPPRHGSNVNPVYWVECNWQGLVTDLQVTTGDPDQSATPELLAATRPHAVFSHTPTASDYGTDVVPPETNTPMPNPDGT